jgi:hypothetical protein
MRGRRRVWKEEEAEVGGASVEAWQSLCGHRGCMREEEGVQTGTLNHLQQLELCGARRSAMELGEEHWKHILILEIFQYQTSGVKSRRLSRHLDVRS